MNLELQDKSIWIAGGSGALGMPIARSFQAEGARVAVTSRDAKKASVLAAELGNDPDRALGLAMDVTDQSSIDAAAAAIQDRFGAIDVLVTSVNVPAYGDFLTLDREVFQASLDAKYFGTIGCMQAALKAMVERKSGAIVNITGTGGTQPTATHMPGGSVNAAIDLMTKAMARRFAPDGIRINAVSPGPCNSPRRKAAAAAGEDQSGYLAEIPMGRFGEPEEVADAVLYLASARASYITGEVLTIDGGLVQAG